MRALPPLLTLALAAPLTGCGRHNGGPNRLGAGETLRQVSARVSAYAIGSSHTMEGT
jgi:hypothetical protein